MMFVITFLTAVMLEFIIWVIVLSIAGRMPPILRVLGIVTALNAITIPMLHIFGPLFELPYGPYLLVGELIVFLVEMVLFKGARSDMPWKVVITGSFLANLVSWQLVYLTLAGGRWLAQYLTTVF